MSWLWELSQMIQFLLTRIDVFLQGLISSCILKLFVAKKVLVTRNYWLSQKIYFYRKSFQYMKLFPEWEIYFLWKKILFWHEIILVAEYIPVWTCVRISPEVKDRDTFMLKEILCEISVSGISIDPIEILLRI